MHAFTVYLWPRLNACADKAWRRAAVRSPVPVTYEGTVEAYKAATCHYRAHPSFSTNKIHNYTPHITLIGPTEVIANLWYCYHWFHYSYLRSSQTRQTGSQHTHTHTHSKGEDKLGGCDDGSGHNRRLFYAFCFSPLWQQMFYEATRNSHRCGLNKNPVAAVCKSLGQLIFPSTCFIFFFFLWAAPASKSNLLLQNKHWSLMRCVHAVFPPQEGKVWSSQLYW